MSEQDNCTSDLPNKKTEVSSKKLLLTRIIVCAVILVVGIILAGIFATMKPVPKQKKGDELIRSLLTMPVKLGDIRLKMSGYGTVSPVRDVLLSAELKGRIVTKNLNLKPGMLVKKDEVLAKIDVSDYEISLNEAEADVLRLKSEKMINEQNITDTANELKSEEKVLELEKSNYNRKKELFAKQITAKQGLEEAEKIVTQQERKVIAMRGELLQFKLQNKSIDAKLKQAYAKKNMAEINIKRSIIVSPFDGRIKNLYIDDGEYVQPGTKLFDIADDSQLEMLVSLDAFEIARVMDLKKVDVRQYKNWFMQPDDVPVMIEWTEAPQVCTWEGRIVRIEKFNEETRTLTVAVRPTVPCLHDGYFPLVDGMFCKVTFWGKTLKGAVKIPWVAIQLDGDVFTVDRNGILHERKITIFNAEGDYVIISSGLNDSELLVIQRLPRGVVNGSRVRPVISKDSTPNN